MDKLDRVKLRTTIPATSTSEMIDRCRKAATELDAHKATIAELVEALDRIVSASDYYGKEASDHDTLTLAYAHQSTGHIARAALAKAKGDV